MDYKFVQLLTGMILRYQDDDLSTDGNEMIKLSKAGIVIKKSLVSGVGESYLKVQNVEFNKEDVVCWWEPDR